MEPTAILTGDIHLRSDTPVCRTDDFNAAQWMKIMWLADLQRKYGCLIIDSGDLSDSWKLTPWAEVQAIRLMPREFYTIPGNHDLPNHNLSMLDKSSLAVLMAAGIVNCCLKPRDFDNFTLYPFPWGSKLEPCVAERNKRIKRVAVCHTMTYQGKSPWPGCKDLDAETLLDKMEGYDLVLTGHNHKPFVVKKDGRLLVNPGSLMRMDASQIDYEPCVWLWFAETNEVEPVYAPIEKNVISREHLDKKRDKDKRLEAYVEKLDGDYDISRKFGDNLEAFFSKNEIPVAVRDIVNECTEEVI